MREATGDHRNQPSPPRMDPRTGPDAVPGGDLPRSAKAGPGFPGGGPPQMPPFDREESIDVIDGRYIPLPGALCPLDGISTRRSARDLAVTMEQVRLTGKIQNAFLSMAESCWYATENSCVAFVGPVDVNRLDAPERVVINAVAGQGRDLMGSYTLKSGGQLVVRIIR